MDEIRKFRDYIKERGLRNTPEREMIIEEIFSIHDHFDVDELFLRMRNKKKTISRASIYRTIPLLVESGLIKEVDINITATCGASTAEGTLSSRMMKSKRFRNRSGKSTVSS
jgi:Fe2+ or Zn2+ uptake regulation protein